MLKEHRLRFIPEFLSGLAMTACIHRRVRQIEFKIGFV